MLVLQALTATLLCLPWLSAFAGGPSPAVWPHWFGFLCFGLALLVWPQGPDQEKLEPFSGASHWLLTTVFAVVLPAIGIGLDLQPLYVATVGALLVMIAAALLGAAEGRTRPGARALALKQATHVETVASPLVTHSGGVTVTSAEALAAHRNTTAKVLAWSVLAAALISTLIGLLQYFKLEGGLAPWVASSSKGESFSNLRQKNQFASLVNIGVFALLMLTPAPRPGPSWVADTPASQGVRTVGLASIWHRFGPGSLAVLAGFALGIGNAIAASRTGVAQALLLVALLVWWFAGSGFRVQAIKIVSAYCVGFAFATYILPRLIAGGASILDRAAIGAEGCHSRLILWRNVWELALQKPWTGWGWGHLDQAHYLGTFEPRFCEILDNAHNLPLHLAVELGLPFAALFTAALLSFLWKTLPRGWFKLPGGSPGEVNSQVSRSDRLASADQVPETHQARAGFTAQHMAWGMVAMILLHSMLEYPLWYAPFQIVFGLSVGLLWPCAWRGSPAAPKTPKNQSIWPYVQYQRSLFAAILIVILLAVAWDYRRISQMYRDPEQRLPAYREDTLTKVRSSWLFGDQVLFAELSITPLTLGNAPEQLVWAQSLLAYSPEPRVIERLIDSATLLGQTVLADQHSRLYQTAFPDEFAAWAQAQKAAQAEANAPAASSPAR